LLRALPYFLLSIQSWIYKIIGSDSLIDAIRGGSPPTWSISTEWFFYFAYPAAAWLILRARSVPVIVLVAVAWCALWTVVSCGLYDRTADISAWAVARFGPIAGSDDQQNSFARWLLYLSPYLRIGEFILGVCTAQLYLALRRRKSGRLENTIGTAVLLAAVASVILIDWLEYDPAVPMTIFRKMNMNFALAPSVALMIFCAARYRNILSRLLSSAPALRLGEASYSIYLFHSIVLISAVKLSGDAVHGVAYNAVKLAILIGIVIAVSMALYAWYEAPARNWLRRRGSIAPAVGGLAEAPQPSVP
jgi:peptidoglycan/LPS O-acetylase OafA/YrhL